MSTHTPVSLPKDYIDSVREYAAIRRGEHPSWTGDRVSNAELYAWRIGRDYPGEAQWFIQSLRDSLTEYVLLTGLPPRSIEIMALEVKRGAREGLREAKAEGRI